jgi:CDGSH-type Zn-finger protein
MTTQGNRRIEIRPDGPYIVHGDVPLVHKTQIVSEYGEPLTWQKGETLATEEQPYALCRCGGSSHKPFCDGSHCDNGFDGTETADTGPSAERRLTYAGGAHIVVRRDFDLCMESGFCGNRMETIQQMVGRTDDTEIRALVMAMVERCPSGALTYAIEEDGPDIEPDLPSQVAVTTEITSEGPIGGPLWVSGSIPVRRSDGLPSETRNRVTLCNCGQSSNKPLCDGTHRHCESAHS